MKPKEKPLEYFFRMLIENKLSFKELSEVYVYYLETKNKEKQVIIGNLAIPLIQYWQGNIPIGQENFIRAKTAYNLLKSKKFETTEIEKDLKKCVENNKYSEDENGLHSMKRKI